MTDKSKYKVNGEGWSIESHNFRVSPSVGANSYCLTAESAEQVARLSSDTCVIEQRYTDKQLELEKDGWTISEGAQDLNRELTVDLHDRSAGFLPAVGMDNTIIWSEIIAYRLTNSDLYKDGVRVVLQEGDWVVADTDDDWEKCINTLQSALGASYWTVLLQGGSRDDLADRRQLTVAQVLNAENAKVNDKPKSDAEKPSSDVFKEVFDMFFKHQDEEIDNHMESSIARMGAAIKTLENLDYIYKGGEIWESPVTSANPKTDWKDGGLPPNNTVCECYHESEKPEECRFIESNGVESVIQWSKFNKGGYDVLGKDWKFRPIQSHRNKVIEKAVIGDSIAYACANVDTYRKWAVDLYDRGMLKMPEGE